MAVLAARPSVTGPTGLLALPVFFPVILNKGGCVVLRLDLVPLVTSVAEGHRLFLQKGFVRRMMGVVTGTTSWEGISDRMVETFPGEGKDLLMAAEA